MSCKSYYHSLSLSLSLSVGIFFLCFSLFLLELVCCIPIFSRVCIIHFFQGQSTFVGRLFLKVLQVYQGYREIYFGRFLGYKNQIGSSNSSLKRSFNSWKIIGGSGMKTSFVNIINNWKFEVENICPLLFCICQHILNEWFEFIISHLFILRSCSKRLKEILQRFSLLDYLIWWISDQCTMMHLIKSFFPNWKPFCNLDETSF